MVQQGVECIQNKMHISPKLGIILGTGLGGVAELVSVDAIIPYEEIPGFPVSTAPGHKGRLIAGTLSGREVLVMQGRNHYYEGYSMQELAIPIRMMKKLGIETIILTNAAGGINESFTPGDVILITDHIKFDLESPVRGKNEEEFGDRFFDMTTVYDNELQEISQKSAKDVGISLQEGVYAYMGGPQFETPAEIRMLRVLGADLVGMSTVPEVIAAAHCGMKVLGFSCVTNMAAGMENGGLNREVIGNAEQIGQERMQKLIQEVAKNL